MADVEREPLAGSVLIRGTFNLRECAPANQDRGFLAALQVGDLRLWLSKADLETLHDQSGALLMGLREKGEPVEPAYVGSDFGAGAQ